MADNPSQGTCSQCGQPLPAGSPFRVCAGCALQDALENPAAVAAEPVRFEEVAEAAAPLPRIPGYEVLEFIGRGGMGVVYRARQRNLDRMVALKLLLGGAYADDAFRRRFRQEAAAAGGLRHPGIVPVFETGEHEGQLYYSMEYVEGADLAAVADGRPLEARRAAAYLRAIADAIHYAHEQGVVHRDLKPANVLIGRDDRPRVSDFGLAKRLGLESSLTLSGHALGSPIYAPPEQASAEHGAVGPASDVYALGAILYFLMTGRPPFLATTLADTLRQVVEQSPVSPRQLNSAVPRDLETVCLKCLEKESARRYGTARALVEDLDRFLANRPIQARPAGVGRRLGKWWKRNPVVGTLAVGLVVAVTVGFGTTLWQWRRAVEANARLIERMTASHLGDAESRFLDGQNLRGLVHLAQAVELAPAHAPAVSRLMAALSYRRHVLPLTVLDQAGAGALHVRFNPDGTRVAIHHAGGKVRIWDALTGEALTNPWQHAENIHLMEFSPGGAFLATVAGVGKASPGREVRVWRVADGAPVSPPLPHPAGLSGLQFGTNATGLSTWTPNGELLLWDLESGRSTTRFKAPGAVQVASLSEDGRQMATAEGIGVVNVWEVESGARLAGPMTVPHRITHLIFSPTPTRLLGVGPAGRAGTVALCLLELPGGEVIARTEVSAYAGEIRFAEEGRRLLAPGLPATHWLSATSLTTLWSATNGTVNRAVLAAETHVALVGERSFRLWDPEGRRPLTEPVDLGSPVQDFEVSPDGERLVVCNAAQQVVVYDLRQPPSPAAQVRGSQPFVRLAVSRDGGRVATANGEGDLQVWDTRTLLPVGDGFHCGTNVAAVSLDRAGARIAFATADQRLSVGEVTTGSRLLDAVSLEMAATGLEFGPDDRWLAVTMGDVVAMFPLGISGTTPTFLRVNEGVGGAEIYGQGRLYASAFSPDGVWLGTAGHNGTGHIWEAATGQRRHVLRHAGPVMDIRFSGDGRGVATASMDGTARVWDVQTGEPLSPPLVHEATVSAACLTPRGDRVVTGSLDKSVRVWETTTGRLLARTELHREPILRGSLSGGGGLFLSFGHEGVVRLWDAATGFTIGEPLQTMDARRAPPVWAGEGRPWFVLNPDGTLERHGWPLAPVPAPEWLPRLAHALAGRHGNGHMGDIDPQHSSVAAELLTLRRVILTTEQHPFYRAWAEWYFRERGPWSERGH